MKRIAILGSTGSIGAQTLDVVRKLGVGYEIVGLSTHSNVEALKYQLRQFRPTIASVWDEGSAVTIRAWCRNRGLRTKIYSGLEGLIAVASHPRSNLVVSAVVGSIGIRPLLAAIGRKKRIALANKEALVVAGTPIMREAHRKGVEIIPVDSEHSALFQCIKGERKSSIKKIILTASGGPLYRKRSRSVFKPTVRDALAHPTWKMGKKITIDSATLMNKGLEAIEASHLFDIPLDRVQIVIHPQSIVHSLVEFVDGSVLAQMSQPDMRLPIQYALTYPERRASPVRELSLTDIKRLEFGSPDFKRFPCLGLALRAGTAGGTMPAVMNAANEVAVMSFLKQDISFSDIPEVVKFIMDHHDVIARPTLDRIMVEDSEARVWAKEFIRHIRN